jgi:4-aminobutyrate aminotransferase-like enzyme
LAEAVAAVRRAGGLYIADEVQAGLGRTGGHMWGFARHGVVPDLVTVGKPMGDGHPVAALMARPAHLAAFGAGARYFNTFGGNPISAAVGLAVLDVIRDEGLMEIAARTGRLLHRGIAELARRHPAAGDVRSAGLYMGIEIVSDPVARTPWAAGAGRLVNALREAGVLVGLCGAANNVVKVRPPLPFGPAEAGIVVDSMAAALAGLEP